MDLGNGVERDQCLEPPGATIQGNVIAGNNGNGIQYGSAGGVISGNSIGTNLSLASGLGNTLNGISLVAATGATITANTIAFNGSSGVLVSATSNTDNITSNSIFSNGALGIDLSPPGVNTNDTGDTDTGANGLQNYPVLTSVNQPTTIAANNCVSRVGVRQSRHQDLGERQAENYLACIILDLYGIVPWILTSGYEYMFEVLGSAHHFAAGRLHIGEVEAKFVVAPTFGRCHECEEKSKGIPFPKAGR